MKSDTDINWDIYPLSIPLFANTNFTLEFTKTVTVITGDNGSGKSTLLEAIADHCGYGASGGSRNHVIFNKNNKNLSNFLQFSWLPKVTSGFFFRAETFASFIQNIDSIQAYEAYGGDSLSHRSHGEGFIDVFKNQFGRRGVYILDEPEAALSPKRQCDLIRIIHDLQKTGDYQFIIATHSPMIMAIPDADLRVIQNGTIRPCEFHETDHFKTLRDFYLYPDGFIQSLLMKE